MRYSASEKLELAKPLGVTYQQVQKYESGTSRIGAGRLQQIAEVLQVPVSFFFDGAPSVVYKSQSKSSGNLPDYAQDFIMTREGQSIANAFSKIRNTHLKGCIANFIEWVAAEPDK
jgi:transcriptional regulator with XRE-family HTH domain